MNPQEQFCHNQTCWAYGRKGEEHIVIHSHRKRNATAARDADAPSLKRKAPPSIASISPKSCSSWCSHCWHMALRPRP